MGRKFRIFTNKDVMDSSELSKKKGAIEQMKYAHNKCFDKKDINFKINYDTLEFTSFKDYSTFMTLVKIFQQSNSTYNNYHIPESIQDGLKSQLYSDDLIMYAKKCSNFDCSEQFERTLDTTVSDNPRLYNHGEIFKVNMSNHQFPAKIKLGDCVTNNDEYNTNECNTCFGNCNCSIYDVVYPSQYEFLNYTTNANPACSFTVDSSCIDASKKQMDSFSVFPRHTKCDSDILPHIHYEKEEMVPKITGCGINSKMHHLILIKEQQMSCCRFNKL